MKNLCLGTLCLLLFGCDMKTDPDRADPPALDSTLTTSIAQLGVTPEWLEIPDHPGTYHQIQKSRDGYLALTPNECFFPRLGLTAGGEGVAADVNNLNGGKSFGHVSGWDPEEVVEWGIWIESPGELILRVRMSSSSTQGRFNLSLGKQATEFVPMESAAETPELVAEFSCRVEETGRHLVRVTNLEKPADDTLLHWVEAAGPAIEGASVLRKRWRPAAAHTRFSSSTATNGVRMWIMEMDAVPGDLDFYAPITTPFGYYGPSWNADGTVKSGMNFSLWSYGRGKKEPPINELSHLLAIGNRQAAFSGFGHEGTGVKIRNWEPLKGRQGQRQAFALRAEPGKQFNTYYSYFYATDEQRWRLFGVGRQKPKRRPLDHLWVGSFVEVPGPPQRQRTGSTVRRMRYRGWVSKDGARWHPLDHMSIGDVDKTTGLTYTDRGVNDDGWFFMQTGGWTFRKAPKQDIAKRANDDSRPEYLQPKTVQALTKIPSSIELAALKHSDGQAHLNYRVRNVGDNAKVFAYFGKDEALTFAKRWAHNIELPSPTEGDNQATIRFDSKLPMQLRLLLQNDHGQFWSFDTATVQ